jgi:hypothetical protein
MTARTLSNMLATWVSIIAAIVGGYVALTTYNREADKTLDDRKKQTLELARLYYSEEFVRIRRTIMESDTNFAELTCHPEKVINDKNKVDYFSHIEFFDMVQICIETGLCDRETAQDFFSAYANWHWPRLKLHIDTTRETEAEFKLKRPYGRGLEMLATSPIQLAPCAMTR